MSLPVNIYCCAILHVFVPLPFFIFLFFYFLLVLTFLWLDFRWAAASGDISLNAMILPAALYFWQIPHFMALAYMCRDDYAAGG